MYKSFPTRFLFNLTYIKQLFGLQVRTVAVGRGNSAEFWDLLTALLLNDLSQLPASTHQKRFTFAGLTAKKQNKETCAEVEKAWQTVSNWTVTYLTKTFPLPLLELRSPTLHCGCRQRRNWMGRPVFVNDDENDEKSCSVFF